MFDSDSRKNRGSSDNTGSTPEHTAGGYTAGHYKHASKANASDFAGMGGSPVNSVTGSGKQDAKAERGSRVDGEYHFTAPEITRSAYSDAGYVPSEYASAVPPRYRYAAPPPERSSGPKEGKRGLGTGAVVALCLVCAILGGVFSAGLTRFADTRSGSYSENGGDSSTVINRVSVSPTPVSTNIVPSGVAIAPTDIYTAACSQAVAITTEITYTNFFGYASSAAVSGSGFIISSNGYILTNHHVIEDAAKGGYTITVLMYDGEKHTASIVGYEKDNDLAVLKIDAEDLTPVTIGSSSSMLVGESVYVVGNPLGELQYTMTDGIVSALDREISSTDKTTGVTTTINMFQISAAINSGNSGGPVYNSRGEVIGIATAKYSDTGVEGLGFAIPIDDAIEIADELISKGYVSGKAYMGIVTETISPAVAQYYSMVEGAYVYKVTSGSCAEKCGLQPGDIIVALDDSAITSRYDLSTAKKNYHAGDSAALRVYRKGEYLLLDIVFDEELPEGSVSRNSSQTD